MAVVHHITKRKSDDWGTPLHLYAQLDEEFHFKFDPCPYPLPEWDGLQVCWEESNFVNPPYSRVKPWVVKCREEQLKGNLSVLLIPARTETAYFHDWVLPHAEIRCVRGRLKYVALGEDADSKESGAPFSSLVCIYHPPPLLVCVHKPP